ncbi:PAS and helix-turn-helix domain-containing protein [Thioclava indica]|uniref:PAS and helix-turn-helix domain-containing protein n=1 Tax=Thioclava indica TaxID=1353528 RepID=UPI0030B8413C
MEIPKQPQSSAADDAFARGEFAALGFMEAPIGLVITENRVIRACNRTFAAMFGYTVEELRDQSFAMLYLSEQEFAQIRDKGVKELREKNRYWDERIMARKDGAQFWCRVRGRTFTPDSPLMRAVWSFADLSEQRPVQPLTPRERQVIMLLGEGDTSKEIARKLDISHRTVELHRASLLRKYNAANVAQLLMALGGLPGTACRRILRYIVSVFSGRRDEQGASSSPCVPAENQCV